MCHHGQHGQSNAVELVEATPQTTSAKSLENFSAVMIAHLVGTVGHHDVKTECATEVLHRLSLSGPGRAGWRASEKHSHSLCQCDVAAIRQWRDNQALLATQVFVLIREIHVCHRDETGAMRAHLVGLVGTPVEAGLLQPLKVLSVDQLFLFVQCHNLVTHVPLVHLDGHKRLDLLPFHFVLHFLL